jgi:hypothetical protein
VWQAEFHTRKNNSSHYGSLYFNLSVFIEEIRMTKTWNRKLENTLCI